MVRQLLHSIPKIRASFQTRNISCNLKEAEIALHGDRLDSAIVSGNIVSSSRVQLWAKRAARGVRANARTSLIGYL
jgi:hypothetical protein